MRLLAALAVVAASLALAACGGGSEERADTTGALETGAAPTVVTETQPAETAPAEEAFQIKVPASAPIGPTSPPQVIKRLQRALAMLGYEVGEPDGVWGPRTGRAVRAFQRQHELDVDGLVGPKTARAINRELRRRR
jgi:peptidoglycan hydrolase-like protein with peptidoglycan-binding domain